MSGALVSQRCLKFHAVLFLSPVSFCASACGRDVCAALSKAGMKGF